MTRIFNVRGGHGSGKSSFPYHAAQTDPGVEFLGDGKIRYTLVPKFEVVLVGWYKSPTGGADGMKDINDVVQSVVIAHQIAMELGFNVYVEGAILSTSVTRFAELYAGIDLTYGPTVTVVFLDVDPEECLLNVLTRNGGKPVNPDNTLRKQKYVMTTPRKFISAGVETIIVKPARGHEEWIRTVAEAVKPGGVTW